MTTTLAFPLTIFAIQGYNRFVLSYLQKPQRPNQLKEKRNDLSWNAPIDSLERLEKLSVFRNVLTLEELLEFKAKTPNRLEAQAMAAETLLLSQKLELEISIRRTRSLTIEKNIGQYWCTHCKSRMKLFPINEAHVAGCRVCQKDDTLLPGVKIARGVFRLSPAEPTLGALELVMWDENEHKFLAADFDEIEISHHKGINLEWFIAAMLEWAIQTDNLRPHPVTIRIAKNITLSANTQRLLDAAVQKLNNRFLIETLKP